MGNERAPVPQKENSEPANAQKSAAQAKTPSRLAFYSPTQNQSTFWVASPDGIPLTRDNLLFLKRTIGNRTVVQLLQRKGKLSQPGDAYEREADRVTDQVLRVPELSPSQPDSFSTSTDGLQSQRFAPAPDAELRRQPMGEEEKRKRPEEETAIQMKPIDGAAVIQRQAMPEREEEPIQTKEEAGQIPTITSQVKSQINNLRGGGGEPLSESARAYFEPRFRQDFSEVRVHTGSQASESARSLNARAYTTGRDVVFSAGEYAPASHAGQQLLAHELAHVIQQRSSSPRVQRKPNPQPISGLRFRYSVSINKVLDGDQLLLEFIKQYSGVATDTEAAALRDKNKWRWDGPPPSVKKTDVEKGYILISVIDPSITPSTETEKKKRGEYFKGLSEGEQARINAEADRQFWEKTKYRAGQKLGTSAEDKQMAEYWKVLRNELIRKRQAIEALPPDIKKFLFDERALAILDPKDFEAVLRIASKVSDLTPAELAEYKSRVTAKTTDWAVYEAAVDRFLAERKEREATAEERRTIETRLFGLEVLYQRYRKHLADWEGEGPPLAQLRRVQKEEKALNEDLIKAGFPGGIADFEKLIRDYEKVFERETMAIARVMLDQYEHLLLREEERYQEASLAAELPAAARLIHQIQGLKTRADFEVSKEAKSIIKRHPLVSNDDFEIEDLAQASEGEAQSIMLKYISARKNDVAETWQNLKDKPTLIYGLDKLLEASFQAHIQSGTIYEKIIRDHISDVSKSEAIPKIILAVIAVAAGLLTAGGGTVAVLAGGTALGIGAYQAIQEFEHYEKMSAAHGARLLKEEPSFAWVVVAVIGAGFDAAAFVSVLPKLRPAIQAFNAGAEADDVAKLAQKLEKLTDVEEGIRKSIIRAAEAEAEARAAWKAVFRPPAALRVVIVPGAEEFGRFVYAVYLTIKRGIREFQVFVKTNEAIDLIGDITKLTAEELAMLKTGYLKALEEVEKVAAHGKALGMTDNEIRAFMNLRGNTKGMTVEQVAKEMDAWKATKGTSVPFGFQSAEQFEKFQATASAELKRLLKKADPNAEAFLQGSSVTGVSYKRHLPFDVESDFDVAVSSRYLLKQAEKLRYEVKLSPRRIGPLDADQIAELGLSRFQERLGNVVAEEGKAAAGTTAGAKPRKINIMLFDNAEAVKKPIGEASTETERAAIPLKGGK